MKIQTKPIDDHDNHCLDAMVEYGELDFGAYLAIILYADRGKIGDILYSDDGIGWRSRVSEKFTNLGNSLISKLPVDKQGHFVWSSFNHGLRTLNGQAQIIADWALTDQCEGGSLQPFKHSYRHLHDYRLPNRTRRKLYSRKWIKRYVKHNKETGALKILFNRIFDRMFTIPIEFVKEGDSFIQESLAWQLDRMPVRRSRLDPKSRKDNKRRRRVLQRSLKAAEMVVPDSMLSAFIRREEISVRGQNLILKVKRTRSLMSEGHGVFNVSVCDLEDTLLATLCVYFEDTPAVDQLIGMMLYVTSGCEEEFVRAANVIHFTEEGKKHPLLSEKYIPVSDVRVSNRPKRMNAAWSLPYSVLKERRESYWNDTKELWLGELSLRVLGCRASKEFVDMYT